jgi:sugar transferase (PEP-CTERM/EpsH1 system associated)
MKILYIAHRIPYPPDKGDKIRAYHQIKHLAAKHELHLACLVDDPADLDHVETLKEICASVSYVYRGRLRTMIQAGLALLTNKPLSAASFYSGALNRSIADKVREERIDVIVTYSSSVAGYVMDNTSVPKVMDFIDVDSAKWEHYADFCRPPMSWVYNMEARRLARREQEIVRRFDHSILVSEREAESLRARTPRRPVYLITKGVDTDYFAPDGDRAPTPNGPTIVFTGVMDYFPNVDAVKYFCDEVFGLIRTEIPEARFCIVGRNPTRQVQQLARNPNVIVTGGVPDVRPYLATASVSVAPLRIARGLQNKVLEAMAMGLPVVTTPAVLEGIQAAAEDGVTTANSPEEFAKEVIALLSNPDLCRERSARARQYVESRHTWGELAVDLEDILCKVAAASPAHA